MRIRTIKPEFFLHELIFEAEKESGLPLRLAFIGLWCAADKAGRFKWEPRRLGIQILPYDDADFSRVLDALTTRGFITRHASPTCEFGVIPSFARHQIINNRERESELPDPSESTESEQIDACTTRAPRDNDLVKHSLSGREGKGMEGNGTRTRDKSLVGRIASRSSQQPDEEWIAGLEADPAYAGIPIRTELAKMQRWCAEKRKQPSRMRLINWLNRADKPLSHSGASSRPAGLIKNWGSDVCPETPSPNSENNQPKP